MLLVVDDGLLLEDDPVPPVPPVVVLLSVVELGMLPEVLGVVDELEDVSVLVDGVVVVVVLVELGVELVPELL